ncbi:MAG: sigma-70 family RNA polymerase sigma factor [Planctomycetes bacterium]|nr:sigma-70 family RNA polymerase sigma factor [Planctomycetota bacterium]MCB9889142.1 sigma-70 family RNA polymerase sigma factor [Planctomycetota bacterium]
MPEGLAPARRGIGEDEELLARYRLSRSVAQRNRLIERFRERVEGIARRLCSRLPRSVDVQDLVNAGMWGLIRAIEGYRPERGSGFTPFMLLRVRGAMIDELRHMDYLPKLYHTRVRMREEAVQRLREQLDRDPSDAELAADLGVSEDRLRRQYGPGSAPRLLALPQPDREDGGDPDVMGSLADSGQEAPIEAINRRELMAKIESSLEPIEWEVLRMHYLEGLTGREVAKRLRLSAARICQIHGRVLSRLKSRLSSAGG